MSSFFVELSMIMLIAILVSFIFHKFNQPLIIGYILTGVLSSPIFFNLLESGTDSYNVFSHIGIAFLLFIVGLHLNLKLIKEIGVVTFVSGLSQIVLTAVFGFLISYLFGFDYFVSFLIGVGLAFSSTIVIVKLLSDLHEIEKVHGKMSMGILIMQDLVAVVMLIFLASVGSSEGGSLVVSLLKTFCVGIVLVGGVLLFSKYVLERILDWIATSQEFLFIFVLGWCFGVSSLFAYFGFSIEVGALLAGVALASSPYEHELSSKIKPLRDFFLIMFFITLGAGLIPGDGGVPGVVEYAEVSFNNYWDVFLNNSVIKFDYIIDVFGELIVPVLVLCLFVLIIKPLIIFMILNLLGFHTRAGFYTAVSLSQISEFSIIMIVMAERLGLAPVSVVSMLTLVVILTIFVSTYLIDHKDRLYEVLKKFLKLIEVRTPLRDKEKEINDQIDVMIFGYDRIGFSLLKSIEGMDKNYILIDYNPIVIKKLDERGVPCVYGDASDLEFVSEFNLEYVDLFISTIPNLSVNRALIELIKKRNKDATVILTSDYIDGALELYTAGADYVILPHFLGGDYVSKLITKYKKDLKELLSEKVIHINELKERKEFGFNHVRSSK